MNATTDQSITIIADGSVLNCADGNKVCIVLSYKCVHVPEYYNIRNY